MIKKIDKALNPISLGDQTTGMAWDAYPPEFLGGACSCRQPGGAGDQPECSVSLLSLSRGDSQLGCSLAGLEAKAIAMQSDLGSNPNGFCMNSHFIQMKEGPGQDCHLVAWGWAQKQVGYWNLRHFDFQS